ncbi:MAG TPA: NADP-dependent oxidoreductase [Solirubrobacteraceae bacterium]|jgi:NADPH:quinone reductase-like Zn-dependent oxidoreductase|nr:NADP-dependent oxidoreductase [Solirubrobacteraceae bacterium]
MHAVVTKRTGGPEVLEYEEVADPSPDDGQVLVRVRAISINPIEWKFRSGLVEKKLPAILGSDISGVVEESRAPEFDAGQEVFGFASSGGYAELALSPAAVLALKPDAVTHEQAAALPVAALTAWQALFDHGGLERGQTVVIAGAAGGVGHLAVQLAANAGAKVVGIGSAHSREHVLGLGADEFIDYNEQQIGDAVSGADLAFDAVGGETTAALLATVRDGGRLVTIANQPPEREAAERGISAVLFHATPDGSQLAKIVDLVASGELSVEIAETLPLREIRHAHELSESGHTRGKIVLRP